MSAPGNRAERRTQLSEDLARAVRVLPTHHPLRDFVAVNPLGGLEGLPFGDALAVCRDVYGVTGTPTEEWFRAEYAQGRITDADLDAAIARRFPDLIDDGSGLPVGDVFGGRHVPALAVLRADLLHGTPSPPPRRRVRTPAEDHAPHVAAEVDRLTATWLRAYLGAEAAAWAMPGAERGFWAAWRELALRDRALSRPVRRQLRSLPARSDDALLDALDRLAVAPTAQVDYLVAHLTRQPGWAAYVRWHSEHDGGIDLVDLVAVRATYESTLLGGRPLGSPGPAMAPAPDDPDHPGASVAGRVAAVAAALGLDRLSAGESAALEARLARLDPQQRPLLWLAAYEEDYRAGLLRTLDRPVPAARSQRPAAHVVCCIDTRSEGLRRHLEHRGDYATIGFAGFFGVPMRYQSLDGDTSDQCPVLLRPTWSIAETAADGAVADHLARRRMVGAADHGLHAAKDGLISPLAFVEPAGVALGPVAAARTVAPRLAERLVARLRRGTLGRPATTVDAVVAVPVTERVEWAHGALTAMGLTSGFAPLVVLCGHGSTTANNPYAASLDCGACGGHRGGANARAAASMLNDPDTRRGLRELDIAIPDDTWFVAAEHDTATDAVAVLDAHLVPATHRGALGRVAADLSAAGAGLAAERCADLPGAARRLRGPAAVRHVATRSADWAQVYPEWGLAGNAAFVVGPRSLTSGLDLGRRVFLHSYDPDTDGDGRVLEAVLTAPLVVAQWINCQYYFSAVAPETFGAGSKTTHNPVGGAGVLTGPDGDLRLGLPTQSLAAGDLLVHEPMRLLAVVQAPLPRIDAVIARNPQLRRLFDNGWIALAARPTPDHPWSRYEAGRWLDRRIACPA